MQTCTCAIVQSRYCGQIVDLHCELAIPQNCLSLYLTSLKSCALSYYIQSIHSFNRLTKQSTDHVPPHNNVATPD